MSNFATATPLRVGQDVELRGRILDDADDSAVDVSSATVKKVHIRNGSGAESEATADFQSDGTDGRLKYEHTVAVAGELRYWFEVEVSGKTYFSTVLKAVVKAPGD